MAKKVRAWPPTGPALPVPVMDNHTHLAVFEGQIPKADGVRLSVPDQLQRAREVGVTRLITVGCSLPEWAPTLQLARETDGVRVALAIHPNEAALHAGVVEQSPDGMTHELQEHHVPLDEALATLRAFATDPLVVAIGETGLDFFRTGESGERAQRESFIAHLELARELGLPLQIHDREAHRETLRVLDEHCGDQQIVFHCYSADADFAREIAKRGWFASFAGPITYPANEHLRQAFLAMPKSQVLVETDAPYLTPVPCRGCPNASYVMPYTVRQMADLWGVALEDACEQIMANSLGLYGSWS